MTTGRKYILDIVDVVGIREKSLTCRIAFFLPRVKKWSSGTDSKTRELNVEKCIAFINTWLVEFKNLTVSVLTGFSPCVQNKYKRLFTRCSDRSFILYTLQNNDWHALLLSGFLRRLASVWKHSYLTESNRMTNSGKTDWKYYWHFLFCPIKKT